MGVPVSTGGLAPTQRAMGNHLQHCFSEILGFPFGSCSDCGKEDAGGSEAGLGQDREGNDNGPEY